MITFVIETEGEIIQRSLHTGMEKPRLSIRDIVLECQADGDELDRVFRHLTLPRMSNKRVVTWFGDDAKFIYANF